MTKLFYSARLWGCCNAAIVLDPDPNPKRKKDLSRKDKSEEISIFKFGPKEPPRSGSGFSKKPWIRLWSCEYGSVTPPVAQNSKLSGLISETGQNFFFVLQFYPASSSNIKSLPSLSSVTWTRTRCAIHLQDSDPDPLVRGCGSGSGSATLDLLVKLMEVLNALNDAATSLAMSGGGGWDWERSTSPLPTTRDWGRPVSPLPPSARDWRTAIQTPLNYREDCSAVAHMPTLFYFFAALGTKLLLNGKNRVPGSGMNIPDHFWVKNS